MDAFLRDISRVSGYRCKRMSIKDDWRETGPVVEKDLDRYLYFVSPQQYLDRGSWFGMSNIATRTHKVDSSWLVIRGIPHL